MSAPQLTVPSKEAIRELRQKVGLTQLESAEEVGVTIKGWQHWEYGKRRMAAATWAFYQDRMRTHERRAARAAKAETLHLSASI